VCVQELLCAKLIRLVKGRGYRVDDGARVGRLFVAYLRVIRVIRVIAFRVIRVIRFIALGLLSLLGY
jgi:hypothetical protein